MKDELRSLSLAVLLSFIAIYTVNYFFGINKQSSINNYATKFEQAVNELENTPTDDVNNIDAIGEETIVTEDKRLNFNNNTVHAESVEYGSAIPLWTVPTMEGFTGKWVGVPETMPAHSIEIYAEYSPIKYTVMWRINGVQKTDVAVYGTEYVLKLNEEEGYPEDVRITVGGAVLSEDLYNYDYTTGTIVIAASAVKGNINIVEKASGNVVNVISSIYGGTSTNKNDTTALRRAYHTTIVPNNGYVLPEEIAIYIDGLYVASGYTYNAETGKLTINAEVIVGEVEIYAECVHKSVIEDPDRPDDPSNCNCNCHSANVFLKFFFNIANFFRKLFGMTQYKYCACNAAHW